MTDYYYDESLATGLNDGTSVANAWQNFTDMIAGITSLTGADTLYWRTADGGGNLSHTLTTNRTLAHAGTVVSPFKIILDDGTVWPTGGGGEFTLNLGGTSTGFDIIFDTGTSIISQDGADRLRLKHQASNTNAGWITFGGGSVYGGITIEHAGTGVGYNGILNNLLGTKNTFKSLTLDITTLDSNATEDLAYFQQGAVGAVEIEIEKLTINFNGASSSKRRYFYSNGYFKTQITIYQLNIVDAIDNFAVFQASTGQRDVFDARIHGFNNADTVGKLVISSQVDGLTATTDVISRIHSVGGTNRYDMLYLDGYGITDFVDNGSFPYLNATLPDGDGWSVRWEPFLCTSDLPAFAPPIRKMYNGTAGTKTVDVEFLILATDADYDLSNLWFTVEYEKSTDGSRVTESTYDSAAGALSTGSVNWSATTFGVDSYTPKKISITTTNSVAANSYLTIRLYTNVDRAVGYYLFYCPDPVIT